MAEYERYLNTHFTVSRLNRFAQERRLPKPSPKPESKQLITNVQPPVVAVPQAAPPKVVPTAAPVVVATPVASIVAPKPANITPAPTSSPAVTVQQSVVESIPPLKQYPTEFPSVPPRPTGGFADDFLFM